MFFTSMLQGGEYIFKIKIIITIIIQANAGSSIGHRATKKLEWEKTLDPVFVFRPETNNLFQFVLYRYFEHFD